jgi:conjugative transfer pilus assembly protein TraH
MLKYLLLLLSGFPYFLLADLNQDLNKFFGQLGVSSHVDSAEIYNGQRAGYMTGGGFMTRNHVIDTQLISVNLPKFDAGCGGIDIFAGGFSFIDHKQLIHTLKGIASNAIGYAFLLGLETTSPQVANIIKQLQTWANTINSIGINSCDTATSLVGAVWPRQTAAKQQICRSLSGKKGAFNDYILARHQCAQSEEFERTMEAWSADEMYEEILKEEYNIAWSAIQKNAFLAKNPQLAELFMSLVGTVISRKAKGSLVVETWPALVNEENFLRALVEGGASKIYSCVNSKDVKCLNLVIKTMQIAPHQSWLGKIQTILVEMQNKILADIPLNQGERDFLAKTKPAVYRIVNVLTAYKKGPCPIDLYQVSEVISIDLLLSTLREVVEVVRSGVVQLQNSQMYDMQIDSYLQQLDRVEDIVRYYELRIAQQMDREHQMMLKIDRLEEQIASEIVL